MINYGVMRGDILACVLDEIDQCIPESRELIKNVSDQTLFKLAERFPVVVSKNLEEMLSFAEENFKVAVIVSTGVDILDSDMLDIEVSNEFKVVNLKDRIGTVILHTADKIDLAKNIFYLDGSSMDSFITGLEWQNKKFSLGHGSFFFPVNSEPACNINLPIIHQLITPAAGINWVNQLNEIGYDNTTVVRFYDYSYLALDCMREIVSSYRGGSYKDFIERLGENKFQFIGKEWDYGFASMYKDVEIKNWKDIISTVNFEFVHINLLESIDISHLIKPVTNTFINFSNIFSYYLTSAFYGLKTRLNAERRILDSLKQYDCYVRFVNRHARAANIYCDDCICEGHISSFFEEKLKLKLPTWHENFRLTSE